MGFCPRCGTETDHRLCTACLRQFHPLLVKVAQFSVTMCPSCGRTLAKNKWSTQPLQEVLEKATERSLTFTQGSRVDGVIIEPIEAVPGKQELQLTVTGSADSEGEAYDEYYGVPVIIAGQLCTECQQLKNQYFTGIIQLRRPNEAVQDEIERQLGRALTNVKDVTGGIDYYVSDHRILQNVARDVHNQFGGELTVRAQHFSYDNLTSKNLYRVNACLRLPKYWKNDVILAGTKLFRIAHMGRQLKGIDLLTGKLASVPFHIEYPVIPTTTATVVSTRPVITILEPETYQAVPLANARAVDDITGPLDSGATVRVADHQGAWILVGLTE